MKLAGVTDLVSSLNGTIKRLNQLNETDLSVGWFPNARYKADLPVAQVAEWQEFGTSRIPARPFIRPAIDGNAVKWEKVIKTMFSKIVAGSLEVEQGFDIIGEVIKNDVKNEINKGNHLPLSPVTLGLRRWKNENGTQDVPASVVWKMFQAVKKGETGAGEFAEPSKNTHPLIDTSLMISTLTYEFGKKNG